MKKLLLLFTVSVLSLQGFTQTSKSEEYNQQASLLGEQLNSALAQKNYEQARLHCRSLLQLFGALEAADYEEQYSQLAEQLTEAINKENYMQAEEYCQEQLRTFNALPERVQQYNKATKIEILYNLACMQSLQGKRKMAVENFSAACKAGYDNYRHANADTDLDNIRHNKTFRRDLNAMRKTSDYLYILQTAPAYARNERPDTLIRFSYMAQDNPDLVRVREYFKLDSVAGTGDELSRIRNVMTFIHNKIRHDGSGGNPQPMNAIGMAEACKDGSRGLNCRGLAIVLNECYLSLGFKSRYVTCMPKVMISDCHVINTVYSETLGKWLWIDPSFNAWVMDENGTMLSIPEVRERLRDGRTVVLNKEANWNNNQPQTKEWYLDTYMAKNLYWLNCTDRSEFGTEAYAVGKIAPKYIALCPEGYTNEYVNNMYRVSDDAWFWQPPTTK